jgi:hypothetical protein
MNVETLIQELTQEIATRQDLLSAIHKYKGNGPAPGPEIRQKTKAKRGRQSTRPGGYDAKKLKPPTAVPAASDSAVVAELDRPKTLGGAMKAVIRNQTRFTGESLRQLMLEDKHYAQLFEMNGPGAFSANLKYWAKQGYLEMAGDAPLEATFKVKHRDWFN